MSRVTYEWVMSHSKESCHIWMSHVTYQWVVSRINESCHIAKSHVTYEWVMSHINESCHVWMSHAIRAYTCTSHVTLVWCTVCCSVLQCVAVCCSQCVAVCCSVPISHANESCHTYKWVMSHVHSIRDVNLSIWLFYTLRRAKTFMIITGGRPHGFRNVSFDKQT